MSIRLGGILQAIIFPATLGANPSTLRILTISLCEMSKPAIERSLSTRKLTVLIAGSGDPAATDPPSAVPPAVSRIKETNRSAASSTSAG